jgi:hypothetical protein
MEKRTKRKTKRRAGRGRRVGKRVASKIKATRVTTGRPERRRVYGGDVRRSCFDCVFCVSSLLVWARSLMSGFPIGGVCANHWETPGRMRPIPGEPCRNFWGKPLRLEPPEPPNDKIRYIPLTRGLFATVDAEDYEWLSQYKWHAQRDRRVATFYACRGSRGQTIKMHRLIMQPPKGMVVDYVNGNGLDNRRCNLRVCTQEENVRNSRHRAHGKSRFKGVSPHGGKWKAMVGQRYLGVFDDEVEAAKAHDREARKQYGEYAWLNIPRGPESQSRGRRRSGPLG